MRVNNEDKIRLIIDIYKDEYEFLKNNPYPKNVYNVTSAIQNGILISDRMTNGDIVRLMFTDATIQYHDATDLVESYVIVNIRNCDTPQYYSREWWDTPYLEGGIL